MRFTLGKKIFFGRWIKHCGWYPDYNLRLFKRSKGRFIEREVHEKAEVKGETKFLTLIRALYIQDPQRFHLKA